MQKLIIHTALTTALLLASSAQAVTVSLDPSSVSTQSENSISLDVLADFSTTEIDGGSIDFGFDSALLAYNNFTWDSSFASFTQDTLIDVQDTDLVSIVFSTSLFGTLTGNGHTLGTITFDALTEGTGSISMTDSLKYGGFVFAGNPVAVSYNNASVDISAVPVPAAVWLFGSGLVGLAGIARRRSA